MNRLLTAKQAGEVLGVNDSRVRQFILEGRLPATKFANAWMIRERDLSVIKERISGRPKKISQARQREPKRNDPDSLPVSKLSGRE